jgi:outer membrane receptor protein involved in Fe transport
MLLVASGAAAQEADTAVSRAPLQLDPITVTGEKTERALRDTASSVSVYDETALRQRPAIESTSDVLKRAPNVTATETSNFAPAVRGLDGTGPAQGIDAFVAGTRPRLNFQIDGRTLSYNESTFLDAVLWDVEQVEVFRGPQSTLQGRNAIAGAVVVKTKDPTYHTEGAGRVVVGSNLARQASAAVSGPVLQDQVALRVAADFKTRDSYIDYTSFPDVENPGEFESVALRGKLLVEPKALPGVSGKLTLFRLDGHAPQVEGVTRPFDAHISFYPTMPVFGTRADSAIADVTWVVGQGLELQTIASLTDLRVRRWATPGDGNAEIKADEAVLEPRLRFSLLDDRLDGFVGLHLFDNEQKETIDTVGGGAFRDEVTTQALFAEGTWHVTDRIDLTLGGRLEREDHERTGALGPFVVDLDETYEAALPRASLAWHATDQLTLGVAVARGYNGGAAGVTFDPPFEAYTYEPEYVWNYELFARSTLLGGALAVDGNLFYSDYDDLQLPIDLNPDPDIWSVVIRNAEEATVYGAEVSTRYLAAPGLELFADLGLLKTEIESFAGSPLEGTELARSPAYTLDLGVAYGQALGFQAGADLRFTDAYFSDVDNQPRGKTDPYWIANAQLGYQFPGMRVFAAVTNIFDSAKPYLIEPGDLTTPADDVGYIAEPRAFRVGLEFTF